MTTACVLFRRRALVPLVAVLVFALVSCAPSSRGPSSGSDAPLRLATPAAPPPGSFIFEIPLPDSLVQSVASLKTDFVEGVLLEATPVAEGRAVGEISALTDVASRLRETGRRVASRMASLGEIDTTFGIPGVSQLVPLSGATRDTIFGYVVWHEGVGGDGPGIVDELERLAGDFRSGGEFAVLVADSIASKTRVARDALAGRDLERSAAAYHDAFELAGFLDSLAVSTDEAAVHLASIIDVVVSGGAVPEGSELEAGWEAVRTDVSELRALASSLGEIQGYAAVTSRVLAHITHSTGRVLNGLNAMVEDDPDENGARLLAWSVLRDDMSGVKGLKLTVLAESVPGLDSVTKRTMAGHLGRVVEADALLAARAVAFSDSTVEEARSEIEATYRRRAGSTVGGSRGEVEAAERRIEEMSRENMYLQSALNGVRQAHGFLDEADAERRAGACHEGDALRQYKNAWLHALNAGANVNRALEELGLR